VSLSAAGAPNHVGDIVETLGLGDIRVVQETGEILIGKDVADWMQEGNQLQLSYVRTGFSRGELNPRIYFNSYDLIGSPIYKSGEPMDIMSFLSDFDALFPGAVDILPQLLGSLDNWTQVISSSNPDDVAEARSVFLRNFVNLLPDMNRDMLRELSVVHFFNDKDSITDQRLEFEFSMNTRIPINTLARDVFTSQLYADMHELIRYMTSLEAMLTPRSVLEELVKNVPANSNLDSEAISNQVKSREDAERRALNATAQSRFNVMLGRIDIHFAQISRQDADLGARMQRMELIEDRLVEDRLNFRQLISDNEDADLVEVSTALSMAQAAYEASLRVGANILQLTLADFIR
jgi:flagellin-like hook-associated protein FlgL